MEYMRMINMLSIDDVIQTPYTFHSVDEEFDDTTLFLVISDGRR